MTTTNNYVRQLVAAIQIANADLHTRTACYMFNCLPGEVTEEMREEAKKHNFLHLYGSKKGGGYV